MSEYIYDPSMDSERVRLAALEAALDPGTISILDRIGVAAGWSCLEVGGGGGSVTSWLCDRVGPGGRVVATDLDTRFLDEIDAVNLDVRRHNAVEDDFDRGAYDLVHSRDVLEHIPARLDVLRKKIDALKPGGWLVVEDVDFAPELHAVGFATSRSHGRLVSAMMDGLVAMMEQRGIDPLFGRRLPELLVEHGLEDVAGEARAPISNGATDRTTLHKLSLARLGPMMVESGVLAQADLDALVTLLDDPGFVIFGPMHVAAWGRAPA
jgi:SAM-dependent methyltransferase